MLSCNQNSSIIQASLHFSNDIQRKPERSHVGASSRARTFSTPLIFHIAYSVSLPVVIGTWISILSNSHVTSALRPVSKSKRMTAASGQVVFSTRSFMFSSPCSAKGYPPSCRCRKRRQQCSGPTFPSWARLTPASLLLRRSSVNRDECPAADPGWGDATEPWAAGRIGALRRRIHFVEEPHLSLAPGLGHRHRIVQLGSVATSRRPGFTRLLDRQADDERHQRGRRVRARSFGRTHPRRVSTGPRPRARRSAGLRASRPSSAGRSGGGCRKGPASRRWRGISGPAARRSCACGKP